MNLLMLVSDLSPAVQLHTEPEYKDETMTVHQIPLTGEHMMLQSERSTCSVTLLKVVKGAASICRPEYGEVYSFACFSQEKDLFERHKTC